MFGLVDGVNDRGLAISLTFGGRTIVGIGLGVPIILRYIMECCDTTADAIEALKRIPCHMSYNVTVVDKHGKYATVYLSPDRKAQVTDQRVATNHQEHVEWHRHARATATVERERFLLQRLTPAQRTRRPFHQRLSEAAPVFDSLRTRLRHGVYRRLLAEAWDRRIPLARRAVEPVPQKPERRTAAYPFPDARAGFSLISH